MQNDALLQPACNAKVTYHLDGSTVFTVAPTLLVGITSWDVKEVLVSSEAKEITEVSLGSHWGLTGGSLGPPGGSLGLRWGLAGVSLGTRWGVAGCSLGARWGFAGVSLDIQGCGRRPQSRRCKMMRS